MDERNLSLKIQGRVDNGLYRVSRAAVGLGFGAQSEVNSFVVGWDFKHLATAVNLRACPRNT